MAFVLLNILISTERVKNVVSTGILHVWGQTNANLWSRSPYVVVSVCLTQQCQMISYLCTDLFPQNTIIWDGETHSPSFYVLSVLFCSHFFSSASLSNQYNKFPTHTYPAVLPHAGTKLWMHFSSRCDSNFNSLISITTWGFNCSKRIKGTIQSPFLNLFP